MVERMELATPRAGRDGKTWWTKVGTAWKVQNGDGWRLIFDALPIPQKNRDGDLEVMVLMRPPFERDDQSRRSPPPVTSGRPASLDDGDDIPF